MRSKEDTIGTAREAKQANIAFVVLSLALGLLYVHLADAEPTKKIPRIGYLTGASPAAVSARIEAFEVGLRDLGYAEGENIVIEYRFADGKPERLSALAADLVSHKVDVIVSAGPAATRPARQATSTIPIVMAPDPDPVGNGFVTSLRQPGGNITGLCSVAPGITGKQLQLLNEAVPRASRVAVLGSSSSPTNAEALQKAERTATTLRLQLKYTDILSPAEIEPAFRGARDAHVGAILVLGGAVFASQRSHVVDLALKTKLPAMYFSRAFVDRGGLMTYGASILDLDRRAATYVDKILKGAKTAELPVEQPKEFEFVINLKTAKQIGLTIAPNVLARADRVIK